MRPIRFSSVATFSIRGLMLCTLLVAIGLTIWKATRPNLSHHMVQQRLARVYPYKTTQREGELQFEPNAKLVEMKLPALYRADPNLRIYKSKFSTGYWMCYPEVEVAVAAWPERSGVETAECLSPIFQDGPPDLSKRLCGIKGKTVAEQNSIAVEICEIYRQIVYKGRLVGGKRTGDEYRAQLWHNDMHWSDVVVRFEKSGAISDVMLDRSRVAPPGTASATPLASKEAE